MIHSTQKNRLFSVIGRKQMASSKIGDQLDLFASSQRLKKPKKVIRVKGSPAQCEKCNERYLSDYEVALRFGVSRASIWRWDKNEPDFPKPIKLSPGTTRWQLSQLVIFEEKRAGRSSAPAKNKNGKEQL